MKRGKESMSARIHYDPLTATGVVTPSTVNGNRVQLVPIGH